MVLYGVLGFLYFIVVIIASHVFVLAFELVQKLHVLHFQRHV